MPKHQTRIPQLQELYDVIRDVDGVDAIDGRSADINYAANIGTLQMIIDSLTIEYGEPTKNHPLLDKIEWRVRDDYRIVVNKASSIDDKFTFHAIYAMSF